MRLIVGLGNPGSQYARHRHNIGFMAVEAIARRYNFGPWRKRFQSETSDGTVDGMKCMALLPQTYMNLSGQAVVQALQFFKLTPEDVIVFHDDLDLAPGKVRVKKGGGHGGHNGLRSLDQHITPNYWRVRLGIGHPGHKDLVSGYVLHDFAKAEQAWLEPLLDTLSVEFPLIASGQPDKYASRIGHMSA